MKLQKFGIVIFVVLTLALPGLIFAQVVPITEVFEPDATQYPSPKFGKVAVVQWNPVQPAPLGITVQEAETFKMGNRRSLESYIRTAASKNAKIVVTSEFGIVGYPVIPGLPPEEDDFRNRDDIAPYVEPVPGPSTQYFGKIAKSLGIYIHIGFAEVDSSNNNYYNVIVVLDPKGEIVAKYRKINLYQLENNFLVRGSAPVTYESPFGKIGLAICADIYSSNPMGAYRKDGIDVYALSTSWAQYNSGMSAFQNAATLAHAYGLAANQNYFPDSGVINPDGTTQSHIRQSEGLAYGYLPYKHPADNIE